MKKLIYLTIFILVVGAAFLIFYPEKSGEQGKPAFSHAEKNIKEAEKYFSINILYPETNIQALNAEISNYTKESVTGFKQVINDNIVSLPEEIKSSLTGSLTMRYSIPLQNGIVSVLFENEEYSGGAHGNVYFKTFNYNLSSGKQVALADLFKENSTYLQKISDIARTKLSEKFREYIGEGLDEGLTMMLELGTEPKTENFQNFVVTAEGLRFFFPPYQVAPYALGTHEILIPFNEFEDILLIGTDLMKEITTVSE